MSALCFWGGSRALFPAVTAAAPEIRSCCTVQYAGSTVTMSLCRFHQIEPQPDLPMLPQDELSQVQMHAASVAAAHCQHCAPTWPLWPLGGFRGTTISHRCRRCTGCGVTFKAHSALPHPGREHAGAVGDDGADRGQGGAHPHVSRRRHVCRLASLNRLQLHDTEFRDITHPSDSGKHSMINPGHCAASQLPQPDFGSSRARLHLSLARRPGQGQGGLLSKSPTLSPVVM